MPPVTQESTPVLGAGTQVTGQIDPRRVGAGLYQRIADALEQIGARAVANIKERLSIPVEIGEHGRIIRSAPGDAPRKEYGILQENVESSIVREEGAIPLPALVVSSSRPPASANDDPEAPRILERELDRPYMTPELVEMKGYAKDMLAKFFEGK